MTTLSTTGRRLISDRLDEHLEHFDAAPIHNRVAEADDGDDLVLELALAAERAYYARKAADRRDAIGSRTRDAYRDLKDALFHRIDECVAQACADALRHGDEWRDHYDDHDIRHARFEARQWLQTHREAAQRAGVWEEVCAHA